MNPEPVYTPSKWGAMYHSLTTNEALGAGSAGPGKSWVLLMEPLTQIMIEHQRCAGPSRIHPFMRKHPKLLKLSLKHPKRWGSSEGWALHLRREFPQLATTIARSHRVFPQLDPKVRWIGSERMWIFSSGYRYQFGHCANSTSHESYMSNEYTIVLFDELVQFEEEQYDLIRSRLRSGDPVLRLFLKVRAMSNPFFRREGTFSTMVGNPHWVRDKFVAPAPEGKKILVKHMTNRKGKKFKRTRIYLPATLYDNPNPEMVAQYEEELLDKPPHIQEALLYGNWFVVPGGYFADAWLRDLHVCEPFRIPPSWKRFRAMDWGYAKQGCIGWYAVDEEDNLYKEREFNFKGMLAPTVAEKVKEIESRMGLWRGKSSGISGPADDQLWEARGDQAKTKADMFAEAGVPWTKANKRSRAANGQKILSRLWAAHPGHATYGKPTLTVFSNCTETIKTLPMIQTDPKEPEAPADGGDDHWCDETGYACAHSSWGQDGLASSEEEIVGDPEEDRQEGLEVDNTTQMGQYGYGF